MFEQLNRFLSRGTETLDDVRALVKEAHETLLALRPTVAALPALVSDARALIADARRLTTKES
jgi:hypothetical protein